jgi:predicted NUDIX family NTP pyrophosphohydrolase
MLKSAGLLMYRLKSEPEFFLIHPGGPFFKNKEYGYWTIPKGLIEGDEDFLEAAIREFKEETGFEPIPPFLKLGFVLQKNRKIVHAWAFEADYNTLEFKSNNFSLEWPPKSGKIQLFPEADKAGWFNENVTRKRIMQTQQTFVDRLQNILIKKYN